MRDIVDLFAGPRGWSEGLRMLGLSDIGLEWDTAACRTAHAAGHLTVQTDVAMYPTAPFKGRIRGKISSPPCQPWSRAGKRAGIADQERVQQAVHDLAHGRDTRAVLRAACCDERSLLAAEPMRWLYDLRPEWTCMEQVPDVLPLWKQYAGVLRGWGYSTWCGILNAADYGVPQTRRRAILIASRVRPVTAPEPTHAQEEQAPGLFGPGRARWVSMADVLPASFRLAGRWVLRNGNQPNAAIRRMDEPAPTVAFGNNSARIEWVRVDRPDVPSVRITEVEAAVLQSFRPDRLWHGNQGSRFTQIANAVPPLLAAHVVSAASGIALPVSACDLEVAA